MGVELKMPALSPTMEEGTLAKWLVKEGDSVVSGDILAEIETDKATMEFEAVDEGTISKILVAEGTDGVKVGTVIALMGGRGRGIRSTTVRAEPVEAPSLSTEKRRQSFDKLRTNGRGQATPSLRRRPALRNSKATPPSPARGRADRVDHRPRGVARCDGGGDAAPTIACS